MLKFFMTHFTNRHAWILFFQGFSSGIPLLLTSGNLTLWLREEGLSLTDIGFFSLVTFPYILKFMWAPILDKVRIPYLTRKMGRRRSWMLFSQCGLIFSIVFLGASHPRIYIHYTAFAAFLVSFFSSCQDITIDAYRIESMKHDEQPLGVALNTFGYRIGLVTAGAGGLAIAHYVNWTASYNAMAFCIIIGIISMFCAHEIYENYDTTISQASLQAIRKNNSMPQMPARYNFTLKYIFYFLGFMLLLVIRNQVADKYAWETWNIPSIIGMYVGMILVIIGVEGGWRKIYGPYQAGIYSSDPVVRWIYSTFLQPFSEIRNHSYWYLILLFVVFYRLSDAFIVGMISPFLVDISFAKLDIAKIVKLYGLIATLSGTVIGAWLVKKLDIWKALLICGLAAMLSNFIFIAQAKMGNHIGMLILTTSIENMTGSMSNAAYMAFLGSLCNIQFTATHYALFGSFGATGRVIFASYAGLAAETLGWNMFFCISVLMGIPGLILLIVLMYLYKEKKIQRI